MKARSFAAWLLAIALAVGCARRPAPNGESPAPQGKEDAGVPPRAAVPGGAVDCGAGSGPTCFRFETPELAFRWIVAKEPRVLAIGEAHAQRGTEAIASSTKRFTESLLPIVAPVASDVVVELWAPDPKCAKEVRQVASAQKPVVQAQAETNQNEYVTLGTAAKRLGLTPWLLRPTCDDFAFLADAGEESVSAMLALVKRLTQAKVTQLYERNLSADAGAKMVLAYGGALHNDLVPPESTKEYSFGPELDRLTGGRYVELDLIVPEFVKKSAVWEKLAWYPAFEADQKRGPHGGATLYVVGERSFALVFPWSSGVGPQP
jgi:hypothetical protein